MLHEFVKVLSLLEVQFPVSKKGKKWGRGALQEWIFSKIKGHNVGAFSNPLQTLQTLVLLYWVANHKLWVVPVLNTLRDGMSQVLVWIFLMIPFRTGSFPGPAGWTFGAPWLSLRKPRDFGLECHCESIMSTRFIQPQAVTVTPGWRGL